MDYEKLGSFYLGKLAAESGEITDTPLLYDAKDLTTHAMCVGMTGSGKTGLCLGLLEEAAMDGVPAIAIDPKGDLGNLLLTFPDLSPSDFEPWVDPAEAERNGLGVAEHAAKVAKQWKAGLAEWQQDGQRIARMRAATELCVYTPGMAGGRPINILGNFAPPASDGDRDAFLERVTATTSGLLALLGIEGDPMQSREHVLIANLLEEAWTRGQATDVAKLIGSIQKPPFERLGVLDLESFFPAADRQKLAMRMNSLLASPSFSAWLEGEPLDVQRLLWTDAGKPKISILYIAHLGEAERMSFVTLLLGEVLSWMRKQSGTTSLRALLYMDEVFGYLPPVANPPSKGPMLTLLKQARAYGLGLVLATQNPVDLDYKALSNMGTWFLGRLQTERDVDRVIEGLAGASSSAGRSFDAGRTRELLAGLAKRRFLMNNVHDEVPALFQTRWAMSYLRGPLTRDQAKRLAGPADGSSVATAEPVASSSPAETTQAAASADERPPVEADVVERFAVPSTQSGPIRYRPAIVGTADVHYANARLDLDEWKRLTCLSSLDADSSRSIWEHGEFGDEPAAEPAPRQPATFSALPSFAASAKTHARWQKSLKTHIYKAAPLILRKCKAVKLTSAPGESESEFTARVRQAVREKRDGKVDKVKERFRKRLSTLQGKITRAEDKVEREKEQVSQQSYQTAISAGTTILGAILGRKVASVGNVGRAASTVKRAGRIAKEKRDVVRAKERLRKLNDELVSLEAELEADLAEQAEAIEVPAIKETLVRPRKADTEVMGVQLLWLADS